MRKGNRVMGIALSGIVFCIAGCLRGRDAGIAGPAADGGGSAFRPDSALVRKIDSLARAADSLRVPLADPFLADLSELAAKLRRLPVPMGTRYNSAPRAAGKAAAGCQGDADLVGLRDTARGLLGIDTVAFFDTAGKPHCAWQAPTLRESHARYVFDAEAGEANESLVVEITEDDRLPRYRTRGTGTIRLFSGIQLGIVSYAVDMLLDNRDAGIIIQDARLELAWRDGYMLRLELAMPKPFRAPDLFPAWETRPGPRLVMSGTIMKGPALAGRIDLFADRTVVIRDRAGTRLP